LALPLLDFPNPKIGLEAGTRQQTDDLIARLFERDARLWGMPDVQGDAGVPSALCALESSAIQLSRLGAIVPNTLKPVQRSFPA